MSMLFMIIWWLKFVTKIWFPYFWHQRAKIICQYVNYFTGVFPIHSFIHFTNLHVLKGNIFILIRVDFEEKIFRKLIN